MCDDKHHNFPQPRKFIHAIVGKLIRIKSVKLQTHRETREIYDAQKAER